MQAATTTRGQAVKTMDIKGKQYVTVAERVRVALEPSEPYQMLSSEVLPLGNTGRFYVRVAIAVDGRQYIGTSEVKLDAPKNTADGSSPIECAETSAVGRALGFAGIGLIDSIASAEEVHRAQRIQAERAG